MTLTPCPTCGRETAALALTGAGVFCPACAPTPELRPHTYRPVSGCDPRAAVEARTSFAVRTHGLAGMAIRNGVCCLDPGDCDGPCEHV